MAKKIDNLEMVETHALSLSLKRLMDGKPNYDDQRWKRALYHAVAMAGVGKYYSGKIREALEMP